jgi:hypothetical protein
VKQNHNITAMKTSRSRKPSIQKVNLAELAGVVDALLADGRDDLAVRLVDVVYYCAERQINTDNVIAFSARARDRGWCA